MLDLQTALAYGSTSTRWREGVCPDVL